MLNIDDEMNGIPIVLLTIIIGFILLGVLVAFLVRKLKSEGITEEPDYRAFVIMGICFLPVGVIFASAVSPGFLGITAMGLIYLAIGLANRNKWKKKFH